MDSQKPREPNLIQVLSLLVSIFYIIALTVGLLNGSFPISLPSSTSPDGLPIQKTQNLAQTLGQGAKPKTPDITSVRPGAWETYFPNRNRFEFEDIVFDSEFDGGNLLRVEKIKFNHYRVWISCDNQYTVYEKFRQTGFFYFRVVVLKKLRHYKQLKITVQNFGNNQRKNVHRGWVPVYRTLPNQTEWQYLPTPLNAIVPLMDYVQVTFSFNITAKDKEVFFASCIPHSTHDTQRFLKELDQRAGKMKDLYYRRDTLTYSLQGRPVELLTLTRRAKKAKQPLTKAVERYAEGYLADLFPNIYYNYKEEREECSFNGSWITPPERFPNKKIILVSARVHPGEAPASHMVEGFLRELFDKFNTTEIKKFFDETVVLVVPMLNPDGVSHGFYRHDVLGKDLNRVYDQEEKSTYPANYALKKVIDYYKETNQFYMFIDLHAHSQYDGLFIFSNSVPNKSDQKDVRYLHDAMNTLCNDFVREISVFTPEKQKVEEGMGRHHLKKSRKLKHIYTIESGYYRGKDGRIPQLVDGKEPAHPEKLYLQDFLNMGRCIAGSVVQIWPNIKKSSPYFQEKLRNS